MMQKELHVTIVVPIFGVEKYIYHCLKSIDCQKYPFLEVVLVNDCTKDHSMEVVETFIKDESRCPTIYRIINHDINKGLSEARNTGIRAATGDYIYFLDSDDYISDDCIEKLACRAQEYNVDIVFGNITRIRKLKNIYIPFKMESRLYDRTEILNLYANGILYREAVNKLLRKTYILEHNLFFVSGMLNEDVNWTFKMLAFPFSAALCDSSTYYYIQEREGSIMSTVSMRNYEAAIQNLEIVDEVIKRRKLGNDILYIKYYVTMIQYTIWFLFYHKNTVYERRVLYYKLRSYGVDYWGYYKKCGVEIAFEHSHLAIKNICLGYALFEVYNIWRRLKGRISHGGFF